MAVLGILFFFNFSLCACTWWVCACMLVHVYGHIRACRYMCMCVCEGMRRPEVDVNSLAQSLSTGAS